MEQALALVGERWTLLVVREVALGVRRFSDLQQATGAPRAVLSDRLRRLVDAGVLERRAYAVPGARARHEYAVTPAGLDLLPVLAAVSDWASKHVAQQPPPAVVYRHAGCGGRVTAQLLCSCGTPIDPGGQIVASVHRQEHP